MDQIKFCTSNVHPVHSWPPHILVNHAWYGCMDVLGVSDFSIFLAFEHSFVIQDF